MIENITEYTLELLKQFIKYSIKRNRIVTFISSAVILLCALLMFLMNDIWRYWYTLTLNYEYRRDNKDDVNKKNWKRLKLKYARLITCFSMLACLYHKGITPEYVAECVRMTPFERLDRVAKENTKLTDIITEIKEEYEWFLSLREEMDNGFDEDDFRMNAFARAEKFHELVVHRMMGVLSEEYPELRNKTDVY